MGREEEEDPADRCLDPAGVISAAAEGGGLRPCIIRGGEESLGGADGDEADNTLGGVVICGGLDSTSGGETTGGPEPDMGDPETAGSAEARGGVEALFRDGDNAAGDVDAES